MKTVVLAVAGIGMGVLLVSGAVATASALVAEHEPHHFANMGAPLWTFTPVYLDRQSQTAGQVAAANPDYVPTVRTAAMDARRSQRTLAASGMMDGAGQQQHAATNLAHMEWCASRYRSYRAEDNSYRSYSGERRSCASPYEQPETHMVSVAPAAVSFEATDSRAAAWCAARYRSYRAADNTYQPYGGERRPCMPPSEIASATP